MKKTNRKKNNRRKTNRKKTDRKKTNRKITNKKKTDLKKTKIKKTKKTNYISRLTLITSICIWSRFETPCLYSMLQVDLDIQL